MTDVRLIHACDECSCGLANGDWTFFDGRVFETREEHEETLARMMANVDAIAASAVCVGRFYIGYADCFVCDETIIDPMGWEIPND